MQLILRKKILNINVIDYRSRQNLLEIAFDNSYFYAIKSIFFSGGNFIEDKSMQKLTIRKILANVGFMLKMRILEKKYLKRRHYIIDILNEYF